MTGNGIDPQLSANAEQLQRGLRDKLSKRTRMWMMVPSASLPSLAYQVQLAGATMPKHSAQGLGFPYGRPSRHAGTANAEAVTSGFPPVIVPIAAVVLLIGICATVAIALRGELTQ